MGFTGLIIFATASGFEHESDDAFWANSAATEKRKTNKIASEQSLRMEASIDNDLPLWIISRVALYCTSGAEAFCEL